MILFLLLILCPFAYADGESDILKRISEIETLSAQQKADLKLSMKIYSRVLKRASANNEISKAPIPEVGELLDQLTRSGVEGVTDDVLRRNFYATTRESLKVIYGLDQPSIFTPHIQSFTRDIGPQIEKTVLLRIRQYMGQIPKGFVSTTRTFAKNHGIMATLVSILLNLSKLGVVGYFGATGRWLLGFKIAGVIPANAVGVTLGGFKKIYRNALFAYRFKNLKILAALQWVEWKTAKRLKQIFGMSYLQDIFTVSGQTVQVRIQWEGWKLFIAEKFGLKSKWSLSLSQMVGFYEELIENSRLPASYLASIMNANIPSELKTFRLIAGVFEVGNFEDQVQFINRFRTVFAVAGEVDLNWYRWLAELSSTRNLNRWYFMLSRMPETAMTLKDFQWGVSRNLLPHLATIHDLNELQWIQFRTAFDKLSVAWKNSNDFLSLKDLNKLKAIFWEAVPPQFRCSYPVSSVY